MKRRTGMKSKQERAKTAPRAFSRDGFHAFPLFREITALMKPRNSDLP